MVLFAVLRDPGPADDKVSADPTATPTDTESSARASQAADKPTARGMETFIRDYVNAVAADPDTAWKMLTPKFQRESGGLAAYRKFWDGVGNARILALSANPDDLVVSYRVRFDNFGTGRRPTVLDLKYDGGRYRIDGERTQGFVPNG